MRLDASHLRTYLRLAHSFFDPERPMVDARGRFQVIEQATTKEGNTLGWLVQVTDNFSKRQATQEVVYSENQCIQYFELGLHAEMSDFYQHNYPATHQADFARFNAAPYISQVIDINRANRTRIDALPEGNVLVGPEIEDIAVRNLMAIDRMPTPGLRLADETLESQLPDGRWVVSLHSRADYQLTMQPYCVFLRCKDFVLKRACDIFLTYNQLSGRSGETAWEWQPYSMRQAWIGHAIAAIQAEQEGPRSIKSTFGKPTL